MYEYLKVSNNLYQAQQFPLILVAVHWNSRYRLQHVLVEYHLFHHPSRQLCWSLYSSEMA